MANELQKEESFYTVKRSKKRHTVSIRLDKSGNVFVNVPYRMTNADVASCVEKHKDWILKTKVKIEAAAARRPSLTPDEKKKMKKEAEICLPPRVMHYAEIMHLFPSRIKITMAEHRFGSCNTEKTVCLSYRLMRYPTSAVDYVIVHELAHLRHMNHSAAFYKTVATYMPDYKERAKLLK